MKNNLLIAFSCLALTGALQAAPLDISDAPIFVNSAVPPLNLLVMGKDHKLYYEAYSDNSDLDGDSVIDVGYKPQIDYFGYFNSNVCYTHANGKFSPSSSATNKKCSGKWSGDFLNYLTTSRMDALRKVLYGGYRAVDSTSSTVLQAAYIPRDGHSWGKEYNPVKESYKISDYAPLSDPAVGHYHLFAVTADTHNSGAVPSLKVLTNTKYRIWEWVSKEAPVASNDCWGGSSCTSKPPTNSETMLPESVVSGLSMTVWGHSNNNQPKDRTAMNSQFNGSKVLCGTTPVNQINSLIGSNGFTIKNNNNIFAGANSSCLSNQKYMVEIKGKINIQQAGSYKFRSVMNGSLDLAIGNYNFESYNGGWNDKTFNLSAGVHDITLRYLKAKRDGEDYWEMQWVPAGSKPDSKMTAYPIKVDVCPSNNAALREDNCKAYPNNGGSAVYKPTGLLHDFGADDKMYFGLLTGSYQKNIDGGVLRSNIDSFTKEINAQTGIYKSDYNGIVQTINNLKLYGYNGTGYTGCGLLLNNPLDLISGQKCHMWGNPIAEMMYEGLRYYSGASAATSNYSYTQSGSVDAGLNLLQPAWKSPYRANGGYPSCAKPVMTVVSDITPSYDYNVPGSNWGSAVSSDPKLASPLDVSAQVDAIWAAEGGGSRTVFIGESGGIKNYAPSPKLVSNLSTVRGLSPEEPSKSGTYYSAGVARFGATEGIQVNSTTNNSMMTYAVALASPLPQIKFPTGSGSYVTVVPFGKSVSYGGLSPNSEFQPTLTIVDFYVQALVNTDPAGSDRDSNVNGGRPYAQFRINYEDVEQGNDHDMDAIVLYTIFINEQGKLIIKLDKEYEAAGIVMHMGYMVSGTTKDGIYLDVKSKGGVAYRLNTPPNRDPGYCTVTSNAGCNNLPEHTMREFTLAAKDVAELLPGPLWYAAKYGMPKRDPATVQGDPDNYFLVTNALTLKDQLTKAFNDIMQKNAAVTRPAIGKAPIGPTVAQERSLYRTEFDAEKWTGSIVKETLDLKTNQPTQDWVSSVPNYNKRVVKMVNASGNGLASFSWSGLENRTFAGKNLRNTFSVNEKGEGDNNGKKRVNYIKGDRSHEDSLLRKRASLLGDIVNSSPVLVSGGQYIPYLANKLFGTDNYAEFSATQATRAPMIYVGANDGMLHGFDANTGEEKFAFIPTPVIQNLYLLTQKTYGVTGEGYHKFYVDGSLHVSDVYINNQWKTILIGALGAGGRGVFALDVTNPEDIQLLWEFTEDSLGSLAATGLSDLGYTFGSPMIIKLKSGEWVAAISSGYNSPNAESGVASLFLLDISTGAVVSKLDAKGQVTNNGLSSFRVADYNSDGLADYIYAGDIQGNLWRFDFTQTTPSISYGAKPLFKAERPITAAPNLVRHPSGVGYLIVVGTGRYLANSDKIPPFSLDSVYGIWDQKTKGEATTALMAVNKSELLKQNFFLQTVADIGDDDKKVTQEIRLLTKKSPNWSTGQHKGWAIDLNVEGNATPDGERMVDEMTVRGEVLFFSTRRPSTDPCESGVEGWTYAVNPSTGGRTDFNVLDLNRSLMVGAEDGYLHGGTLIPVTGFKAPPGGFILTGDKMISSDGTVMDYQARSSNKNRESWFVIPKGKAE